jgi:hypothetical protein
MKTVIAMIAIAVLTAAMPQEDQYSRLERRAIQAVRQTPVSKLERGLPSRSFDAWLMQLIGSNTAVNWELNDCGEQTGNPKFDRGRDFPMCVSAIATLMDGRRVDILIAVGTQHSGITQPFVLFFASIGKGGEVQDFRKLSDLAERIKAKD